MSAVTTDVGPWFPVPLWLIESASPGALKLYALLGAKWANRETNECFPSHKTLSEALEVSRASVQRHLDELELLGALERARRTRDDGSSASNLYVLNLLPPASHMEGGCLTNEAGSPNERGTVNRESINQNQLTRSNTSLSSTSNSKKDKLPPAGFAEFWTAYSAARKSRKADAVKAYAKALDRDGQEVLDAGLAKWLKHWEIEKTESRFIPHASTWLNKSDYLDAPPTSQDHDRFTDEERESVLALMRDLSPEEITRLRLASEHPYDAETLRRLGD